MANIYIHNPKERSCSRVLPKHQRWGWGELHQWLAWGPGQKPLREVKAKWRRGVGKRHSIFGYGEEQDSSSQAWPGREMMKKGAIAQLLNSKVHGGIYQEVQLASSIRELWTGPTSLLSCSAHVFLLLNLCQIPTQILGCLSLYCWAFWKLSPKPLVLNSFSLSKSLLRVWRSLQVCFQPKSVHHTGFANLKHMAALQLTEEIWSLASWLSISLWGAECMSPGGWDRNDMWGNRSSASLLEDAWLFCNERLEEKNPTETSWQWRKGEE